MTAEHTAEQINPRIEAGIPFVEALARRVAATMPHSIDLGDLVQDGVIGLIDAAKRFEESRGIKFETFAERRVRGAMIDALRKDAWPRGVRRVRRELEAARERLRLSLGHEPSLADLAAAVGSDEERLGKVICASTPSSRPRRSHAPRTSTNRSSPPCSCRWKRNVPTPPTNAAKCRPACVAPSRRCRRANVASSPSTTTAKSR